MANPDKITRNIPFIELNSYLIDPEIVNILPEKLAKKYKMVPLFKIKDALTVAMSDPMNIIAIDEARMMTGCNIHPVVSNETDILKTIDQFYGVSDSMDEIIKNIGKMGITFGKEEQLDLLRLQRISEEPPVIKFVNLLLSQAIKEKASDVHIEPEENTVKIRFRIDGILHESISFPQHLQLPIVPRIKIVAGLDIVERRRPQDGRFRVRIEDREVDVRVSTFPVAFGEKVVLRILDKKETSVNLEKLGFPTDTLEKFKILIKKPYGIILVTGPTGSGKTSTLYASLQKINSPGKNIITLEDPREYFLKGINQAEMNPEAGFTFADGLRAVLRQDPDIIMVGEVRDLETVEIAMRAALTGHLVLTTLHTNDAIGAVTRLIDMHVEPFLISSALIGVLAQRLVRTICTNCREQYKLSEELITTLAMQQLNENIVFYRGKGCRICHQTGYRGRTGIFELILVDDDLRELITKKTIPAILKETARKKGMKTLREAGWEKVVQGITTPEEILRVTES